jgi:hypothetical protein
MILLRNIHDETIRTGYEGNPFTVTGNLEEDLLNITSVHPMREDAVDEFLSTTNRDWTKINSLVKQNKLLRIQYRGNTFYIRNFGVQM